MNRNFKFLSVFTAFILMFITAIYAGGSYNWYCKRQVDHACPRVDPEMAFIKKYDAAYIGKNPKEKVLYLTFDAGYENGNVAKVLDVLKKHNVKGAFFVLDNIVRRNPELIMRMINEGHLVCNHTAHHRDMTKLTDDDFAYELASLEMIVKEETGKDLAKYYRPPKGQFSEQNLISAQKLGYKTVFWSLAYADWDNGKQPDPEKSKKLLLDNTHNGAVILLHPTSKTNSDILGELILAWEKEGYRFGMLDELF